jgi:ATP-dependent helicase HrpA
MPPSITFDPALPVSEKRHEIAQAIAENQITIVCGETGSGKTTQIPKILLEMGRGKHKYIGHTQPRRIAARSVAARIAEELKVELGSLVGYKVRFTDRVGKDTTLNDQNDRRKRRCFTIAGSNGRWTYLCVLKKNSCRLLWRQTRPCSHRRHG